MARPKKEKQEEPTQDDSKSFFESILDDTQEDHFNDVVPISSKISTGSLTLDRFVSLRSGNVVRLIGAPELGKTSEAFVIADNYMKTMPKSKTLYLKCEGRLSKELQARTGHKFVTQAKDWEYGTVFVWAINIFETIADSLERLIQRMHADGEHLCIIWDSLDGTLLKSDSEKAIWNGESPKVAGVPLLMKLLFKRLSLPISHFDVLMIVTTQYSQAIKLDTYAPTVHRQGNGSGGSSVAHQADYAWEYLHRYNGDYILEDDKEKPDIYKNKILGIYVTVELKKTGTDESNQKIKIPIKKGRTGNAIWIEKELADLIVGFSLVTKNGSWFSFSPKIIQEALDNGVTLKESFQGLAFLYDYLESDKSVFDFFYKKVAAIS